MNTQPTSRARLRPFIPAAFMLLVTCSSAPPPAPEIGVEGHAQAAAGHEAAAAREAAQYNPGARDLNVHCHGGASGPEAESVCWTSVANPTEAHVRAAAWYRRQAATHRAAIEALRVAEARSCTAMSDLNRAMSPFEHPEDIASVAALGEAVPGQPGNVIRVVGATVSFRAVPGMTADWLQHVIDCHLARNAAIGHDRPEAPECPACPLELDHITARVSPSPTGFAVALRADDPAMAQELLHRSLLLVAP